MGRRSYPGGIISGAEPTVNGAGASGMWTLQTAAQKKTANTWPIRGVVAVISNTAPTISNVAVTDSSYNVLNDTPYINSTGGYIKITGTNFASGAVAYIGGSAAVTTSFISSTELRCQVAAGSSNTVPVYVVNSDNSTGIKLAAVTYSGTPSWVTSSTLADQLMDFEFTINLSATSDSTITYTLDTGSSLPPGTSLYSNGIFAGTVANTSISVDTAYSFSVNANDAENQDTSRTFTVTVVLGDPYFYQTSLLLNANPGNTWVTDSSSSRVAVTVSGDTRPSAFNPYATYWSGYFDGTGDYLSVAASSAVAFGTGPYTIEFWFYGDTSAGAYQPIINSGNNFNLYFNTSIMSLWNGSGPVFSASTAVPKNKWTFIQIVRTSTSSNGTAIIINGSSTTGTDSSNWGSSTYTFTIAYDATPRYLTGYVTDFRISNMARTSVIPSSRLTSDANTLFLTCQNSRFIDNGPSAITITKTGDAAVRNFTPWLDTTDTIIGSGYFDGTGDYVTRTNINFSTNPFTIEGWFYPTTLDSNRNFWGTNNGAGSTPKMLMYVNASSQLVIDMGNAAATQFPIAVSLSTYGITVGQWSHIALVRSDLTATGLKLYVNGVLAGTGQLSTNLSTITGTFNIGYIGEAYGSPFVGYISNFRINNGTAVYTGNFTPATTSLTATQSSATNVAAISDSSTSLLTLQYRQGENNHRFIDESGQKGLVVRAGNATMGSFTPYSPQGWAVWFNGSTGYLTSSSSAAMTQQATFTIECWIYVQSLSAAVNIVDNRPGSTNGNYLDWGVNTNGTLAVYVNSVTIGTTSTAITAGAWYHVAYVRTGGVGKIYINGTQGASFADTTTYVETAFKIGYAAFNSGWFAGYISNFRYVNGYAIYTENFTPQTTSLTNVAGTMLLTCQNNRFIDNTGQGITVTATNTVRVQSVTPFRTFTANTYNTSYSPTLHGGSMYIDGSGDYITYNAPVGLTFSANDFTIEFWTYIRSTGAFWAYDSRPGADGAYPLVYYDGTSFVYYVSTGARITSAAFNPVGQWTHVVVSRVAGSTRMFINGVQAGSTYTDSTAYLTPGTTRPVIGINGLNSANGASGYVSGLKVMNGTGVTTVTVPTSPTPISANTVLYSTFTNAALVDQKTGVDVETGSGAKVGNTIVKYGSGALSFNGSSDYLNLNHIGGGLVNLIGDVTIEAWCYLNSLTSSTVFYINGNVNNYAACRIQANNDGTITLFVSTSGSAWAINQASAVVYSAGNWFHLAMIRSGNNINLYYNGNAVIQSTAITSTTALMNDTSYNYIGVVPAGFYFNGYMDEIRITKNYARFTANFTVPSSEFLTK